MKKTKSNIHLSESHRTLEHFPDNPDSYKLPIGWNFFSTLLLWRRAMFEAHALFDSRDVASYIAQQCIQMRYGYNNTKIQKLLYCVYGAVLAQFGARIIDEHPKAWPYGPVFPKAFNYIHDGYQLDLYSNLLEDVLSQEEKSFICSIISYFGKYTAGQLSNWSHKPGSPWQKAVDVEGSGWNVIVRDADIRDYFLENVLATN